MFVFGKYNLKSDYMYFLPTNFTTNDSEFSFTFFAIFGVVLIILIAVFFFRDSISLAKESAKHKIRELLKPIFFKVNGDTVHTVKEGPLQIVWEYLDTYFLQPSEPSTLYDYIGDEEGGEDDDDEYDDVDDDDGKEGMEEYEEDDDEE
jgi:hypothetical protein